MPGFSLQHYVTHEVEEDFELSVRCFGSVFSIRYLPENIRSPSLFKIYRQLLVEYDEAGDQAVVAQLIKPFESIMGSVASLNQRYALSDYLYPRLFTLEATAGPGDTELTPRIEEKAASASGDYLDRWPELQDLETWVPRIYRSTQIRLPGPPERDTRLSGPEKVLVGGESFFFKGWKRCDILRGANLRELRTYKQINEALTSGKISPELRICRLRGVVVDSDAETPLRAKGRDAELRNSAGPRLVGLLLTFIETKKELLRMGTLSYGIRCENCDPEMRSRWADDIDAAVAALHGAGIVWGDAKPDNILVDDDDDVWIVDFGGSYTDGWVDEDESETMEGDRQGVERIKAFLGQGLLVDAGSCTPATEGVVVA